MPLLDTVQIGNITQVSVQMYNTWAQVETIDYAISYAYSLVQGFEVSSEGTTYNVTIPASKLALGFPASTQAAGSGWISPPAVVAAVQGLASNHTMHGISLMTWDIGWDFTAGWPFADAVLPSAAFLLDE